MVAVEVKTSVADFRGDAKWPEYLDWCDAFYFAVPAGFPQELVPDTCGLIVADAWDGAILRVPPALRLAPARRRHLMLRFAPAARGRPHRLIAPEARRRVRVRRQRGGLHPRPRPVRRSRGTGTGETQVPVWAT